MNTSRNKINLDYVYCLLFDKQMHERIIIHTWTLFWKLICLKYHILYCTRFVYVDS